MKNIDWDSIVEDYHSMVISPFQRGVANPLFGKIALIKNKKKKNVMDVGCGRGEILDRLAKRFKKVYAVDFSSGMVKYAKENTKSQNIEFFVKDMRKISRYKKFRNNLDVIISVNSILSPKIKNARLSLEAIYGSLKKGGKFYGIFPSMGSILYHSFLVLEDELKTQKNEKKALSQAKRITEFNQYNMLNGTFNDSGQIQKFYYDFELKIRLQQSGFKNVKFTKVLYPWKKSISDHIDFPGKPKMWDWFVSAEK